MKVVLILYRAEFTAAGGVWTVVMSTCFITFFGEIIPQSYCMKHALFVGGHVYWICWYARHLWQQLGLF